jgi:FHA domain-containing protein/regulatory LuxR family protein
MADAPRLHSASPAELKEQIEAERRGEPFLVFRDGSGTQRIFTLGDSERVTVGRASATDIWLDWDTEVSRLHAELARIGDDWTVSDDGLSSNGSFLNGDRLAGRRRLRDGDAIRFGQTLAVFRAPRASDAGSTMIAEDSPEAAQLSDAQRRVLVALCRPYKDGSAYSTPATNQQVADELFLSVDAVKTHLRALFGKFGVEDLPQNQKRVKLVENALRSGAIAPRDL